MFSDASVDAGCNVRYAGLDFWMAGQRVDPNSKSPFIWRVVREDGNLETPMTYTNWAETQPDYYGQNEACVHFHSSSDYKWNDEKCETFLVCSVCEIEMKYGSAKVEPETESDNATSIYIKFE